MKPSLSDRVRIAGDVLFQVVGGETVLLDLASETYFGLDEVGTRIWSLLQADHTLAEVHSILLSEYEVESRLMEEDLLSHVDELQKAGLVTLIRNGSETPA